MTLGTVHGRILDRPGSSQDFAFLGHAEIATASMISFQLAQFAPYREYLLHISGVEKPSTNIFTPGINISTNGASFETAVAYQSIRSEFDATATTVQVGGSSAAGNILVNSIFNLATATGKGGGDMYVRFKNGGSANVDQRIQIEWYYSNSASNEAFSIVSGLFASGPLTGIALDGGAGTPTFSARADLYGLGRTPS